VFISYRHTELEFSAKLAADLSGAGFHIWMDVYSLQPGDNWIREIQIAISTCTVFLSILSPAYVTSRVCQNELQRAVNLEKFIIPVLLEPILPLEYPLTIETIQYVDFHLWHDEKNYQAKLSQLTAVLQAKSNFLVGTPKTLHAPSALPAIVRERDRLDEISSRLVRVPFKQRKIKAYSDRLDLYQKQWDALNRQLDTTMEGDIRVILEHKIAALSNDIDQLEREIEALEKT
jgi:hypothetical protein